MKQRGFLKCAFGRALAWPIARPGYRGATFAATFMMSPDFLSFQRTPLLSFMKARELVLDMTKITKKIDDAIDTEDPKVIAAADFLKDDDGVCNFLKNRKYVPACFLQTMDLLSGHGLISKDVGIGYSNLFCEMVHDRAKIQCQLAENPDPDIRLDMAQKNLEFASIFGCFFFGMIKPLKADISHPTEIRPSMVKSAYPDIYSINALGQILDDLRDIMIDWDDEATHNRVSPNIFLAHALQTPEDYNSLHLLQAQIRRHKIESIQPKHFPDSLKNSFSGVGELFFAHASHVSGWMSRTIVESFWYNTAAEGINTSFHERVRSRDRIEAARYDSYK